jgi:hypothetical protein
MGDRRTIFLLFGFAMMLILPLSLNTAVFADDDDDDDGDKKYAKHHDDDDDDDDYKKKYKKNTTKAIHLGFLQLAAHDFFNMNRCTDSEGNFPQDSGNLPLGCEDVVPFEFDSENGKLDASTVLFNPKGGMCDFEKSLNNIDGCELYDGTNGGDIANGGEPRSVENIMISTASAEVGGKYLKLVDKFDGDAEKAYKKTLKFYHKQLQKAYEESFHLKFPKAKSGELTNLHNLAVRIGHDFLPAELTINGETKSIFEIPPLGEKLDKKEKRQQSLPLDGEFHDVFTHIEAFCLPGFCINVDLLNADRTFGEQFAFDDGPKYNQHMDGDTFDEFLGETADGKFNKKDRVSKLLKQAFSHGLYLAPSADEPSKIEICHKDKKTKTIPEDKLSKHLAHGDELGPCDDNDDDD